MLVQVYISCVMELLQPCPRQGSKGTTADADKQPRFGARAVPLSVQPPETLLSNPSSLSPLPIKWKVSGQRQKNKAAFSAARSAHTGSAAVRENSWLCVCCDNGESFPRSQHRSAVFAEINPAS